MKLTVLGTVANYKAPYEPSRTTTNEGNNTVSSVSIKFNISELFEDVNAGEHNNLLIKVLKSEHDQALTPESQINLVKNKFIEEINSGQLVIGWTGYDYRLSGESIDAVVLRFKTFDKDIENKLSIKDEFVIPYTQYQEDIQNGVDGLIEDIKQHLIDEFSA